MAILVPLILHPHIAIGRIVMPQHALQNTGADPSRQDSALAQLGLGGAVSIVWRYFREKATEQVKTIWFIIVYLAVFQILFLDLPIIHGATITVGIAIVVIGLTLFMEGLRLGLMPFGETIGAILPRNSKLPLIMAFAFILGVGATFAEPAISVLKRAGSGVAPETAPLLYSLLNDFSHELVACVGVGVGLAVMLGILRFFFGWSLKILIIPLVLVLSGLTIYAFLTPSLEPVIGLAWDCGAVTTGPVTVPLVLALGIGVCRIIGDDNDRGAGFGVVTLASLFPIIAVLALAFFHHVRQDYYGASNYRGEVIESVLPGETTEPEAAEPEAADPFEPITEEEFREYRETGVLPGKPGDYRTIYRGGEITLADGRIVHSGADVLYVKKKQENMLRDFFAE